MVFEQGKRLLLFGRKLADLFYLRYLPVDFSFFRRMQREVAQEPDDDGSNQDDSSHLMQILLGFLPHVEHDGFPGRHTVRWQLHDKGHVFFLKQEALEYPRHDYRQEYACQIEHQED